MDILEKITEDIKEAMRAKDAFRRDTLRLLRSEMLMPDADEPVVVLRRAQKMRRESAEQYREGGREDLAEQAEKEMAIIESYLPPSLSEEEARQAIEAIARELGLSEKKDMGKLMQAVMAKHQGTIDGKLASKIASSILG
ncbi:MAG: GatB/YqeY domain-containing protein [Sandaracinaceae bacterium]|nr:GatB/YqeY domain-containing protein [Sandaracinaceae bacterium]